jgi:hypothetical protein
MHECIHTLANEMDRLGVAGCKEHRDELVARLRKLYDEEEVAAALSQPGLGFPVNRADLFGSLVDEAIRRAEARGSR